MGWGPTAAVLDPGFDIGDLRIFKTAGGRHFEAWIGIPKRLKQQTLGRISGDDDYAQFAAFEGMFGRIELETAHSFIGMAGVADIREQRANMRLEELFVGGFRPGGLL